MTDLPPYPENSTPRWVKVFAAITLVVILLFLVMLVTRGPGGHGPSRHLPSGDARDRSPAPPRSGPG
jgi:hypothetical protein